LGVVDGVVDGVVQQGPIAGRVDFSACRGVGGVAVADRVGECGVQGSQFSVSMLDPDRRGFQAVQQPPSEISLIVGS